MRALGIEVDDDLLRRWSSWYAPTLQPFLVDPREDTDLASLGLDHQPFGDEVRDTFGLYAEPDGTVRWLDEEQYAALPRATRARLLGAQRRLGRDPLPTLRAWGAVVGRAAYDAGDGHRFVWWPSVLAGHESEVLRDYVEEGRRPSRHAEVEPTTWRAAAGPVPGARALAGTFPARSGPNCFGTVMAAAGVVNAEHEWMQREPFEEWLTTCTRSAAGPRYDEEPGTVLVWRSPDGLVQHAAVTLGDGWALHKPSQGWMSPTKVLSVADCAASARDAGRRIERRVITSAGD